MRLGYLFDTPSSFEGDARGFARNAAGHTFAVGYTPILLFGALPALPAAMLLYAIWEILQWRWRKAEAWDCFHDWAYVCAGAIAALHPLVLLPLAAFYVADILRRTKGGIHGTEIHQSPDH